ncbi:hypothetical protein OAZ27_06110 [Bacteroidia bacterium]|nr:hypothetical protein [Bacteroidia bacterium]
MKILQFTLLCTSIILSNSTLAQGSFRRPYQPYLGYNITLASSHFLSDLGGKNADGSHGPEDLDIASTRYALGTRIFFHTRSGFSIITDVNFARLYGDDKEAKSSRTKRNIHVRTDIFETIVKVEYTFNRSGIYLNLGGGLCFFKPKAQLDGTWYDLRPLGTEGQNIDPEKSVYKKYTPIIPFGVGKKFELNNNMSIAIDCSLRKSFSDYLDDVSTKYYDREAIGDHSGDVAKQLSSRAGAYAPTHAEPGSIRGNPNFNDNYFFIGFKLSSRLQNPTVHTQSKNLRKISVPAGNIK